MTREDIVRMAKESDREGDPVVVSYTWLERFAALVVAAEREACAKVCEGSLIVEINPERSTALEKYLLMEGAKAGTKTAAAAIRARGKE